MIKLVNLSHSIDELLPAYPGDLPVRLLKTKTYQKDGFTNYQLVTGMHSGTHLDGPMHGYKPRQLLQNIDFNLFSAKP